MSKQHHFTVWYDTELETWDIGHASFEEDKPLYDTKADQWKGLYGEDAQRDGVILDDLRRRIRTSKED